MFERSRWGQGLLDRRYDARTLEPTDRNRSAAPEPRCRASHTEGDAEVLAELWLSRAGRRAVRVARIDAERVVLSLFGSSIDASQWRPLVGMTLFEVLHLGGAQLHIVRDEGQWRVRLEASRFELAVNGIPLEGVVAVIEDGDRLSTNTLEFLFCEEGSG